MDSTIMKYLLILMVIIHFKSVVTNKTFDDNADQHIDHEIREETVEYSSTRPIINENILTTSTQPSDIYTTAPPEHECENYEKSPEQPQYKKNAKINKCCPFGENFQQIDGVIGCASSTLNLSVIPVYITLYGNNECVRDMESRIDLEIEHNNVCNDQNEKLVYIDGDQESLFIIQNGSLMVIRMDNSALDFFNCYCVEHHEKLNTLIAVVCDNENLPVISGMVLILFFGMTLPVFALLFTISAYLLVPPLNNIFGRLVSLFSGFYLVGLVLMTIAKCGDSCVPEPTIYIFQSIADFLFLSSIFCFLLMNLYNCSYAGYYLHNNLEFDFKNKEDLIIFLIVAYILATFGPVLPFKRTYTFFTPLLILFLANTGVIITNYYLLRAVKSIVRQIIKIKRNIIGNSNYERTLQDLPLLDIERASTIRAMNKYCIVQLIISFTIWFCSTITQHMETDYRGVVSSYLLFGQGLSIFIVFVCWKEQWRIIREWWFNKGSLELRRAEQHDDTEMQPLTEKPVLI